MSTSRLFDVHTHTQFAVYAEDRDAVIQRALDAKIWMVQVGTQRDTSRDAIRLAHQYSHGVYAAVGLHPLHTSPSHHDEQEFEKNNDFTRHGEEFDFEAYKTMALDLKVVAVGECGLDYYRVTNDEVRIRQKDIFQKQIELASDVQKPLMIHCRDAFNDLVSILQPITYNLKPGIVHFFSGTKDDAKKLLAFGFSFSFGGVVTFARDYDEVVRYIPLDRIMLETDAPYVSPVPHRGKRNEPLFVEEVAKKIAELKNIPREECMAVTSENAKRIFSI